MWGGFGGGGGRLKAVPGTYTVRLSMGDWSQEQTFDYQADPRLETTQAEYEEQQRFAREVGEATKSLYAALLTMRDVKEQAMGIVQRLQKAGEGEELMEAAREMNRKLTEVEGELTQLEGDGGQDALKLPGPPR